MHRFSSIRELPETFRGSPRPRTVSSAGATARLSRSLAAGAPSAAISASGLLALQADIGNRAVTSLLQTPRRAELQRCSARDGGPDGLPTVQRSAEDSDAEAQQSLDEQKAQEIAARGKAKIREELKKLGKNRPTGERRSGGGKIVRRDLKKYRMHPYYRDIPYPILATFRIQRAATATGYGGGQLNWNAAKPNNLGPPLPPKNKQFGAIRAARNTSTGTFNVSLHQEANGGAVGPTRPDDWWEFIAMLGGGRRPFVQGHSLHQKLGGLGTHQNLSPFTTSLNGLHYGRAEQQVVSYANGVRHPAYADYDVDVNYGANAGIRNYARTEFANVAAADVEWTAATMEEAGIITLAQATAYTNNGSIPPAKKTLGRNWLDTYVADAFPSDIDIDAEFIEPNAGAYDSTGVQSINITNDI